MGETLLIASGKGGTGKSMFAVNMAAVLAKKEYRVIIVDMDMGQGCIDLYLGMHDKVVYNVYDAASGMCKNRQAILKDSRFECLHIMAAPPHKNDGTVTKENISKLYDTLKQKYDYVIVDAPAGIDENLVLAAEAADRAVIVATADYAAVRGADTLDNVLRDMGIKKRYCVLNMVKPGVMELGGCLSFEEISKFLKTRVIGVVPYDEIVGASLNMGIPVVIGDDSFMCENIANISSRIVRKKL